MNNLLTILETWIKLQHKLGKSADEISDSCIQLTNTLINDWAADKANTHIEYHMLSLLKDSAAKIIHWKVNSLISKEN